MKIIGTFMKQDPNKEKEFKQDCKDSLRIITGPPV